MQIPNVDARELFDEEHVRHSAALDIVRRAALDIGFLTVSHTGIKSAQVKALLHTYRQFFLLPTASKASVDMSRTGSNRGWGAPGAEQVNPAANPDFKQVFDSGLELAPDDPLSSHTYYAPNQWPDQPVEFRHRVLDYYQQASSVALALLSAVAQAIGEPEDYFNDKFDKPMALLRGNYYPPRSPDACEQDFGIAPHTDYGCLTLLATDGTPGLEIKTREHGWLAVCEPPGVFIINFGEMLEMWTRGAVVATEHRVIGSNAERLSVPLFFNPRFDVNVAPAGSDEIVLAGDHLQQRYDGTYVHRQQTKTL